MRATIARDDVRIAERRVSLQSIHMMRARAYARWSQCFRAYQVWPTAHRKRHRCAHVILGFCDFDHTGLFGERQHAAPVDGRSSRNGSCSARTTHKNARGPRSVTKIKKSKLKYTKIMTKLVFNVHNTKVFMYVSCTLKTNLFWPKMGKVI